MLNEHGQVLKQLTVPNNEAGFTRLLAWANHGHTDEPRTWAIEGANNPFTRPLCAHLLAAGEPLHAIHPSQTSLYRSKRTKAKTDELDAQYIARVLIAHPECPLVQPSAGQQLCQSLSRTRRRLSAQLKGNQMSLQQLPDEPAFLHVRQAVQTLINTMQQTMAQLDAQLRVQVRSQQPELLGMYGVGVVLAGTILPEVGDIRRFGTRDQFASYCGAAPVARGSGGSWRWCVNTGGNRRMNYVLHMIVLTRKGRDERTKAYFAKHLAQGKPVRAIFRNLKTIVARELFDLFHRAVSTPNQPPPRPLRA